MANYCRHNFHEECEAAINKQTNLQLHVSYCYLALEAFYSRDDVALKGFAKFFSESAKNERERAERWVEYQSLRGGRHVLQPIGRPTKDEWDTPLAAMEYALALEKEVNQSLLTLHQLASAHNDPHLTDHLEEKYLDEQVERIYKLSSHVTNLQRVGDGLGVFIFDKDLQ